MVSLPLPWHKESHFLPTPWSKGCWDQVLELLAGEPFWSPGCGGACGRPVGICACLLPLYCPLLGCRGCHCLRSQLLFTSDSLFSSLLGDANRQISEYKFKLSKAEQDITTLEQSVSTCSARYQVIHTPFATSCIRVANSRGTQLSLGCLVVGSL